MQLVTDPKLLDELNSGYGASSGAQSSNIQQPQQEQNDDGSILDTIGAGYSRMGRNVLASLVTDPDSSDYELAKAKNASRDYQQERSKLGTVSGLVADIGEYAPVVAAGAVNPVAGAAVMGGMSTADTLAQQQEAGQSYNLGNAATTGLASAATDYATAGLAGRGVNIARNLSRPAQRVSGEIGSQAAQAGVSNAASTAYQNIALGRPWDENLGEAATVGSVTGGAIHGAAMGARNAGNMAGFAQRFNRPVNDDGRRVMSDTNSLSGETGGVHQDFANNAAEHANEYGNQFNELMDAPITSDSTQKITDMVDASMSRAGDDDAALSAMSLAQKKGAPLTAKAFDVNVGGRNLARDVMGKSERDLEKSGATLYSDMSPLIFGKEKAKSKGYNFEQQMKNLKTSFDEGYTEILSPVREVRNKLTNLIQDKNSSLYGSDGKIDPNYSVALNAAKALDDGISKYASGKSIHKLDDTSLRNNSVTLMRSLNEVGMLRDLKNFDGSAFNPVKTARAAYTYSDMFHQQNPSIHDYNPNTLKSEGKDISKSTIAGDIASDAMLSHFGIPPFKTVGRVASSALRPMRNRKAFDKARSEADEFIQNAQNTSQERMQEHLQQGDTASAADEAATNLREMGINPVDESTTARPVESEPEAESVPQPVEEQPVVRTPTDGVMARTPNREVPVQEPAIDPEVEAAQRASRQEALSQDARVDAQRRAPVEEPSQPREEVEETEPSTSTPETPEPREEAVKESDEASEPKESPEQLKKRVMLPLRQREESFSKVRNRDVDSSMPRTPEWRKAKEFRESTEQSIRRYAATPSSGISEEGVYAAIDYHGGIDQMIRTMEENGYKTPQQALPSIVANYKTKLTEDAKVAAKSVVDTASEDVNAATVADRDKAVEQLRTDMRSAVPKMDDDMFNQAIKMAEDNAPEGQIYTVRQVGNYFKRLLNEANPTEPKGSKKGSKTADPKPPKPTAMDSYKELYEYARDLFVDGDNNVSIPREIKKDIDVVTRTRNRGNKGVGLSDSAMKSVMNKMHKYIDDQHEALQNALSKPDTAQPTELASWRHKIKDFENFKENITKAEEGKAKREEVIKKRAEEKAAKLEAEQNKEVNDKIEESVKKSESSKTEIDAADKVKKAIESTLEGKNPDEVGAITEAIVQHIPENMSSLSDPSYQVFNASINTLAGKMGTVGLRDDAKAIRLTRDAIREALKRKSEFPNNPDFWLSQSDMRQINDALKRRPDQTSTYMGDLGVRARLAVFGSSNTNDLVVHTNGKLEELMREERKRQKAATIGEGVIGEFGIDAPDIK